MKADEIVQEQLTMLTGPLFSTCSQRTWVLQRTLAQVPFTEIGTVYIFL